MKSAWKDFLSALPNGWIFDPPVVHRLDIDFQVANVKAGYKRGGGSCQKFRSKDPFQAGYYDLPYYRAAISNLRTFLSKDPLVVDLGCGDGRGVELLLETGVSHIIAQDFNEDDLFRLWDGLEIPQRSFVLPVCSSVTDTPLLPGEADAVLMMEVAGSFEEPFDAYWALSRWLRDGGYALVSNYAREAYFVHGLLNRDWNQVRSIAKESRYMDRVGEQLMQVNLYTRESMVQASQKAGFKLVDSKIIPAGAGLLLHALRQTGELDEDKLPLLKTVAKNISSIPRLYFDILRLEG